MHPSSLPQHNKTPTAAIRTASNAIALPSAYLTSAPANAPSAPGPGAPLQGPFPGPNGKRPGRPSKTKPGRHLLKSLSTPQLRGPIMSDSDDKKRNKLGYQRISIACAHCRRRKIRCLVADDDREGRCQNCIRLKKECVFYPVDQQAVIDARSESSRAGGPSATPSTVSSSPNQGGSSSFDPQGPQYAGGFPNVPRDTQPPYQGIPIPPNLSIPTQGQFGAQDHSYGPQGENWSPREYRMPNQALPVAPPSNMHPPTRFGAQSLAADTAPFPPPLNQPQPPFQQMEGYHYNPEQMWHAQQPQPQHQPTNQRPPGSFTRHPSQQHMQTNWYCHTPPYGHGSEEGHARTKRGLHRPVRWVVQGAGADRSMRHALPGSMASKQCQMPNIVQGDPRDGRDFFGSPATPWRKSAAPGVWWQPTPHRKT
ncbi:hypothetical protein DOTSEDRAFT_68103, partial [Lecanosticta acicola]